MKMILLSLWLLVGACLLYNSLNETSSTKVTKWNPTWYIEAQKPVLIDDPTVTFDYKKGVFIVSETLPFGFVNPLAESPDCLNWKAL